MTNKVIGIDLGTTNSVVSVREGGETIVITNSEGNRTTPSMIAIAQSGEVSVGQSAKRQAVTNPQNTIFSVKRFMGRQFDEVGEEEKTVPYQIVKNTKGTVDIIIQDKHYSPQELSARILQKLKQTAEDYLGTEVKKAVITVPAYFNDAQRQATIEAGTIAGLEVLRLVAEPTAAALAYGMNKKNQEKKIAVFDLGGGTFDVSILEVADGVFEVCATNGDTHLGGDDFDQVLINYLADTFKKENAVDLRNDQMALQRLKEAAEKAKCELSSSLETDVNLPFITANQSGPMHLNINIQRSKYESLCENLLERLKKPCLNALKDSSLSASEIDEVVLVGGMSRMPAVQEMVSSIFQKEPNKSINPDEVVAEGAAVQGGILAGDSDVNDLVLLDVTPLSLGIETMGGICTKLIERNTTIPTKKSQIFSTAADNQPEVDIVVLQGEREMSVDNKELGRFKLQGITPAPRGVPQIEVTFDIDANGIVHVSAKDKATGKEQKIRIESDSSLSEEEIQRMVDEAAKNSEADKEKRELIELKNESESLISQIEKNIKDLGDKVPNEEKEKAETAIRELREVLPEGSKEDIQSKKESLMQTSHKIAEIAYQQTQEETQAASTTTAQEKANEEASDPVDAEVVDEDKINNK